MQVHVREVRAADFAELGRICVEAYRALPGAVDEPEYQALLADVASRAAVTTVLVAVDDGDRLLGSITYVPDVGSDFAEHQDPDAASFRMLAVDPALQGLGAGQALVEACIERARAAGRHRVIIHTTSWMPAAHRLYRRLGFHREPSLDQAATPRVELVAFVLELP